MHSLGYNHVMLDDCWAATSRDAADDLQPDASRFPRGMPSLISSLHALNLSVGLYTSVGPTTCSSGNRSGHIPGSYGHYAQDAALFARWGVDAVTLDFCDYSFNDTLLFPSVVTQQFSDALNATGRAIWLLAHCVGYNMLDSAWCAAYMNSGTIWSDHHDTWATTTDIFFFMAWHPDWVGAPSMVWPDPDFLMTGGAGCENATVGMRCPGMTDDEYRSEVGWLKAGVDDDEGMRM